MSYEIHVKPRSEREALIEKALEASTPTERLDDFRGESVDLKVISLEIGLPVYRMVNCRTFSQQQSSILKNGRDTSFFKKGQESTEAQSEQHRILIKITKNAKASITDIYAVLKSEGQREPLLITSTGVVVNGNRRLSALRDMYNQHPAKYSMFSHVKCAVLPAHATANNIDDLEAALQARPQTKLEYDWIGDAQLIRRQLDKGRSPEEVAAQLRRKPAEIKNIMSALEEAKIYLDSWVKKPGEYTLVLEDGEQLFKDIPKQISSQDTQMKEASRAIAWSLFENAGRFSGRIYSYNAAFGKLAPQVIAKVTEELGIDVGKTEGGKSDQFNVAIDEDDQAPDYSQFISALREEDTKEEALEALAEACVTAIESDRGKKRKDAALKSLAQIHSRLAAIDIATAGKGTYQSMINQIEAIEEKLLKLKNKISKALEADASRKGKSGGGK